MNQETLSPIKKESLIGKRIPKKDAPLKVAGEVKYINDLKLPGMLYGKILRSERVHALIKKIDTRRAEALPGVHVVLTGDRTPKVPFGHGRDNYPLKFDKVRCYWDEVAAVAAESEEIAEEALKLIEVEYEDLPGLFSPQDSLKDGAPIIHEKVSNNVPFVWDYSNGDVLEGERESDHIIEDTFKLHFVTHCCMGVSGVIADCNSQGDLTVYSQTQVPFLYKKDISPVVGIAPEKIRVIQPVLGGGFGSKLDIYPFEPIAILLSKAVQRPVKLLFSRKEEFISSPTRQPVELKLRSGVKKDGTLTFRECTTLHDNGGYTSWGATTPFVIMQTISSLYRVPHCKYQTKVVYTNNPYSGSFRGFGNLQATFAIETHMDKLAEIVDMDPLTFRLQNSQEPGETTPQGMVFRSCGMKESLLKAAQRSHFLEKHKLYREGKGISKIAPEGSQESSLAPSEVRRGIGMASMVHVGGGAKIYRTDGCGTILKLDDYGHVTLLTGSSEIGQGSETVLSQIVAEELGLEVSDVTVINNDSDVKPWDVGVHASRTTFIAGNSARRAALKAREKLLGAVSGSFKIPYEELDLRKGHIVNRRDGVPITSIGKFLRQMHFAEKNEIIMTTEYYEPPSVSQDREFKGDVSASYAFATQVAEISVDTETGVLRVDKVTSCHDVGRVINELLIEGQVEGGVVMGCGYALSENLMVREGVVKNPSFRDYKLFTATEIPEIEMEFIETSDPEGPYGAKGIGEAPAIPTAAAIANALYNATGVRFYELPLTPENVLKGLEDSKWKS